VRIVVCGPAGAGKTCFVTAAATETFPEHVPPHVPPTLLCVDALPDRVPALLLDTSSRAEDRGALAAALASAHAVVLCYAVDAPRAATLAALRDEWLPELRRAAGAASVILLGCKLDLRPPGAPAAPPLAPELLADVPRLELSLECSSKTLVAVHEAVYAAHRAVLYPTAPLFDACAQALAPDAVAALRRIFAACDTDGDGALSSSEVNAFQEACFGAPLAAVELEDLRRVVSEQLPAGAGVTPDGAGLTLAGFLYLHALFIEHGRADTVWTVLRRFGYDGRLRLSSVALGGAAVCGGLLSARPPDAAVELSERAAAFVDAVFARATAATRRTLQRSELDELFATAPGGAALATFELGWTRTVNWDTAFSAGGPGLSARSFAALWALSAASSPLVALEHLIYLGYAGKPSGALWVGKRRALERARRRTGARGRHTLQALLCGPHDVGKCALLHALAALGCADAMPGLCGSLPTPTGGDADEAAQLLAAACVRTPDVSATGCCMALQEDRLAKGVCCAAAVLTASRLNAPLLADVVQGSACTPRVTLALHASRAVEASQSTAAEPQLAAAADAFVFVFDAASRSSFDAAAAELTRLVAHARIDVPALLVAAHECSVQSSLPRREDADSMLCLWDNGVVGAFCASLGLPPPLHVNMAPGSSSAVELFSRLIDAATATAPLVPETRAAMTARLRRRLLRRTLAYTAGAAAAAGGGVLLLRWWQRIRKRD
jgi:Ras family protein T1